MDAGFKHSPSPTKRLEQLPEFTGSSSVDAWAEVPALQSLIYSTWNWDSANIELYGDIKERAQALSPDFRVSLFQVLIAIAFVRGHTDLLKSLFATRPPEETIFDIANASKIPPEKYDLAAWTMVLNSTWIHRANASWRLEGWTNILISHLNDVPEDDAGKLEAFVKALKSHNFTPIVETLEPVVSSGTAASVYNLSIFFSVYPARSLGPSRNSLLRMAALENRATKLPIIRVLLTAGLDPNWIAPKRDYTPTDLRGDDWPELWGQTDRETALHVAARQGDLELAKLLVKHGARKWVKDGLGKTAKQRAEEHGQSEMVKYLRGWFFGLR